MNVGPSPAALAAEPRSPTLPERLAALAALTRICRDRDGFDTELLADSERVLRRAGERLRMSAGHTVVAIAGGTGSGKSTLFNALSGASFSPTGVIRPTTREIRACVWGMRGTGPLLDWLGVERRYRYGRASELDAGETALHGLVLLDLPDHDSVVASSAAAVDRITGLADMLIWVLDPQKYADAAVHNRYLVPLAGRAGLFTLVLSQIDTLTPEQVDDCTEDLGRLLASEGLDDAWLHAVSARTGDGLDELRALLTDAVSASNAAADRISADIDSLLGRYEGYAAGPVVAEAPGPAVAGAPGVPGAPGLNGASGAEGAGGSDGAAGAGQSAGASGAAGAAGAVESAGAAGISGAAGVPGVGETAGNGPFPASVIADTGFERPGPLPKRPARPPWEMTEEELAELRAERNRPPWEVGEPGGDGRRELDPAGPGAVEEDPAELARNVPEAAATALIDAFADASGLLAVADGQASARKAQSARLASWPPGRGMRRALRWRDPVRSLRSAAARTGKPGSVSGSGAVSGPGGGAAGTSAGLASQPEVDNAITALVDAVDGRLPESWSASVQRAARSRAGEVPAALADALRLAVPRHPAVPLRWRLVAAWQWLLLLLAVAAVAWAVVLGVTHGSHELRHLLGPNALREPTSPGDVVLTVWLPVLAVVLLLLGWLTSAACRNMGVAAVDRDRERAGIVMREHVAAVARGLVLAPVGREIAVYERFRRELSVARGGTPVAYGEFPVAYGNADRGDQSV